MLENNSFGELNNNKRTHHSAPNFCSLKLWLQLHKPSLTPSIPSEEDWWWKVVRLKAKDNTRAQLTVDQKFFPRKESLDFSRATWVTSGEVSVALWSWFFTTNSKKCLPTTDIERDEGLGRLDKGSLIA